MRTEVTAYPLEQANEREWMVSLVCPEVHISGDPVRFQRAILAALGNAFLEGAELVGRVVDVIDDQVLLSIGHDASIDDSKAVAYRQEGPMDLIQDAIDACPVTCIHWTEDPDRFEQINDDRDGCR